MRRLVAVVFIIMFAFMAACAGETKKVSEDSKTAGDAFAAAEAVKDAYIRGDMKALAEHTTREGYRTIISVLKKFDGAELSFNPTWVEIDRDRVLLHEAWKGKWTLGGDTFEERGTAVFVLKDRPLKVDNVLRANPFRYPQ